MVKIAINRCFGGFGLSDEAYRWLIDNCGWQPNLETSCIDDKQIYYVQNNKFKHYYRCWENEERNNKDLIDCIEVLGSKANGLCACLKIVEIPDDVEWEIHDYDGIESIHEKHRSWY